MKSLLILRHGKAEGYDQKPDKDRCLIERGEHDAKKMGQLIHDQIGTPDLVVSSDATRARETAEIAAKAANYKNAVEYTSAIYSASLSDLVKVIHSLPETAATVLIVGHNPGLTELANFLTNAQVSLPTAGLAHVKIKGHWNNLTAGSADLVADYAPKLL